MALLSRDDLDTLLTESYGTAVSIYLPTVRAGQETQQNPIRFKNLLREVEKRLSEREMEAGDVESFLAPLAGLHGDLEFWQHQQEGLAVFLADGFFETYELPVSVEEMAVVNARFYLKPLFTLFRGDGRFYVLALSQKNVRFFEGSRYQLREIELPEDVPHRLEEVVGYQLEEQNLQFHSGTQARGSASRAPRSPIYHGQGGGEQVQKDEVAKFFSRLDKALHDHLPNKNVPLVLAGVEWLLPIYRQASEHQNLLDHGIHGNPDGWSAGELHGRAWEIVRPQIIADRERAAERFGDLIGTGRASNRVEDVVAAAFDGRVDTLFVAQGEHRWGEFDPASREVKVFERQENGAEDLLDFAAVRTFMTGGTVYSLERDRLPGESGSVAAIFRY